MTGAPHPLGLTTPDEAPNPEWEAAQRRYDQNANDNEWLSQFVAPREIPADEDHDDPVEPRDIRPSLLTFAIALALIVGTLLATILPAILN